MKTFKEHLEDKRVFEIGKPMQNVYHDLCEEFIKYVDEIVMPDIYDKKEIALDISCAKVASGQDITEEDVENCNLFFKHMNDHINNNHMTVEFEEEEFKYTVIHKGQSDTSRNYISYVCFEKEQTPKKVLKALGIKDKNAIVLIGRCERLLNK